MAQPRNNQVYVLQHGSTPQLRVANDTLWYVIRETWNGKMMVDQTIVSRHETEDEARAALPKADAAGDA